MTYTADQLIAGLDAAGALALADRIVLQQSGDTKLSRSTLDLLAQLIYATLSDDDPALTADSDDLLPTKSAVREFVERHFSPVVTESATSHDITNAEAGSYIRFTNGSASTCTFRDDATHALDDDVEFHIRCAGGDLTLTPGSTDVILNEPAGGTLVLEDGMTVTVKRVAVDEFDVIGQTVPA